MSNAASVLVHESERKSMVSPFVENADQLTDGKKGAAPERSVDRRSDHARRALRIATSEAAIAADGRTHSTSYQVSNTESSRYQSAV